MWKWIKFPKIGALACFILPWMSVSCDGHELTSANGFHLAFGYPSTGDYDASMNLWLVLAIVAIAVGIYLTVRHGRKSARAVVATSGAALALILIGTHRYSRESLIEQAAKENGRPLNADDVASLNAFQVDWHIGYWLTLLFLIAALVMALLVMLGKDDEADVRIRSMAADVSGAARDAASRAEDAASSGAAPMKDAITPDTPPTAAPSEAPPESAPPSSAPDDPGPR